MDSLEMHIRRVNYQSYIWLHADDKQPDLQDLEVSGWKVRTEGIESEWTNGDIVPQELIEILCASGDEHGNETDEDGDEVEMVSLIGDIFDDHDDGDDD